jgi:metallo-beta-lactamase family protein
MMLETIASDITVDPRVDLMATLQFLGATGTVTGSRFVVRTRRATVLVDAGMFQGRKRDRQMNWEPFPVDPGDIDAVVVTHAHIDHSGWLPGLARDGYRGPVFATTATCELCRILLPDSAHLQEEQARFANERGFSKHHPALALYTTEDAHAALELLEGVRFETPVEIADGVTARFVPAGHILGSASVHLTIVDTDPAGRETTTTLLVSGDLGRGDHPLIPGPGTPPAARTVLVESTYGDSTHPDERDEIDALADLVTRTAERGGIVLIPAFAVDRTEVLLVVLRDLMASGRIPTLRVHVDSPMALRVLDVYRSAMSTADPLECHPLPAGVAADDVFDPGGGLDECPTVEDSKSLNALTAPAIIVSASGMATGGRVLHHLARLLPDHRNSVVLCGFQAAGTRGRSLADGARSVKMLGHYVPVRAEIHQLRSLSVHADADGLQRWVTTLPEPPDTVFVVHGEPDASEALADRLVAADVNAIVPTRFEVVQLD